MPNPQDFFSNDTVAHTTDTVVALAADNGVVETQSAAQGQEQVYQTIHNPTPASNNAGGGSNMVGWLGVLLALGVAVAAWKLIDVVRTDLASLRRTVKSLQGSNAELVEQMRALSDTIDSVKDDVKKLKTNALLPPKQKPAKEEARTTVRAAEVRAAEVTPEPQPQPQPKKPAAQVRYATLQAPDANGVLRFAERSMSETPSAQQMFMLHINTNSGVGTYQVNPAAMSMILGDLQLFQKFVKPFTASGGIASIRDKRAGKIIRDGNFWIVEEPLEITID